MAYEGCVLFALYFCYIIMLVLSPQVRKGYKDREAVSAPSLYERFLDEEEGELTPRKCAAAQLPVRPGPVILTYCFTRIEAKM